MILAVNRSLASMGLQHVDVLVDYTFVKIAREKSNHSFFAVGEKKEEKKKGKKKDEKREKHIVFVRDIHTEGIK